MARRIAEPGITPLQHQARVEQFQAQGGCAPGAVRSCCWWAARKACGNRPCWACCQVQSAFHCNIGSASLHACRRPHKCTSSCTALHKPMDEGRPRRQSHHGPGAAPAGPHAHHGVLQALLLAIYQRPLAAARVAGLTISAAAVGVGARTSATKSAIVKSVSCPTPLTTGTGAGQQSCAPGFVVEGPEVFHGAATAHQQNGIHALDWRSRVAVERLQRLHQRGRRPSPCTKAGATTTCTWGTRGAGPSPHRAGPPRPARSPDRCCAACNGSGRLRAAVKQALGLQLPP